MPYLKITTLESEVDVTVPPGNQPDAVLRLRGNLNLRIQVHIRERLSAEERTLYEQLSTLGQSGKQKQHWWQ